MKKYSLFLLSLLLLTGCHKAAQKTTAYYCLTPLGWTQFDDQDGKAGQGNGYVWLHTDTNVLHFTACVSGREK